MQWQYFFWIVCFYVSLFTPFSSVSLLVCFLRYFFASLFLYSFVCLRTPSSICFPCPRKSRHESTSELFRCVLQSATADGQRLSRHIQHDKDPCSTWDTDLRRCISAAKNEPTDNGFWECLTETCYDMDAITKFFQLDTFDAEVESFQSFLEGYFTKYFKEMLQQNSQEVEESLRSFPLAACGDRYTTAACQRVSCSFGLPRNGQALHSLFHGRMNYFARGPWDSAKVRVLPSESAWNLTSHRGGCWLIGHSSVGKDQCLAIIEAINSHVCQCFPQLPINNKLEVGRLTYAGLLESLQNGASSDGSVHWLSWLNSEIKQCLGRRDSDIQEADFCQLAEASVMGKRTKQELKKFRPSFWFAIGAHPRSLHDFLGTTENGRLRGFSVHILRNEVLDIGFPEKMGSHRASLALLKTTAATLVSLQHINEALLSTEHTSSALVVFVALHEAARKVAQTVPQDDTSVASRLWPAMIKFIGKAHTALTFTNLCLRVALWRSFLVRAFFCEQLLGGNCPTANRVQASHLLSTKFIFE